MPRVADLDRGGPRVPVGKKPEMLEVAEKQGRDGTREGLRQLDGMVERQPGMTRHGKDENRAIPRDGTSDVRSRRFPPDAESRRLTGYRQRILNRQKTAMNRAKIPIRAKAAFAAVFGPDQAELSRINELLADNVGDVEAFDEATARRVRRVDRVIRMAEAYNAADNIVYTPIHPPAGVNSGNVQAWLGRNFGDGAEVDFDRYTITSHSAVQAEKNRTDWLPLCEIVTRRGQYIGNAPTSDGPHENAVHLLPRGMRLRCVGVKTVTIARPDGTTTQRTVLQLEDLT